MIIFYNHYLDSRPVFLTSDDKNDYPGYGQGFVSIFNLKSLKVANILTITSVDSLARDHPQDQFSQLSLSADSRSLFVYIDENRKTTNYDKLLIVNLNKGFAKSVFSGYNLKQVAWSEGNMSP